MSIASCVMAKSFERSIKGEVAQRRVPSIQLKERRRPERNPIAEYGPAHPKDLSVPEVNFHYSRPELWI
jgi:hypothetical protein